MDKKNLSKHKHVWKVVREFDSGMYHVYKYPVIYINSQVTYYSPGGKQMLSYVPTVHIKDELDLSQPITTGLYWEVKNKETLKEDLGKLNIDQRKHSLEKLEMEIKRIQNKIDQNGKEILELEKKIREKQKLLERIKDEKNRIQS